jgi:geranylgeranyl diphosphate synthase type II
MTTLATIRSYLEQQQAQFDEELKRLLPSEDAYPESIHRAMRYSIFAGGKRLRPLLALEAARLFGRECRDVVRLGCAVEMIHVYSLIHDDLPALDNDDLRRGKPTSHRVFGEAAAILAGDALVTLAFEVLAGSDPDETGGAADQVPASARLRVIRELSHAIGTCGGLLGGQVVDLESTRCVPDARTLEYIHSAKTGALIRAAVRCGAIYAQAPEEDVGRVSVYGAKIGLAFQIVDDLLDVLGSQAELGKTVGKDDRQQKATYPAIHGIEASQRMAFQLVEGACEVLEPYGDRAHTLQSIAQYLLVRQN